MKIGDKVSTIDDDVDGVVTGIDEGIVTILTHEGFELQFLEKELVATGDTLLKKELNFEEISKAKVEKQEKKPKKTKKARIRERNAPPMEVDLHIHQLIKNHQRMSNYDILSLQIETAERQLKFAIQKRIQKIVFIHGVGEGVLQKELEFLFGRYDGIKYYEADFQKYGRGALEVYIFQNQKN